MGETEERFKELEKLRRWSAAVMASAEGNEGPINKLLKTELRAYDKMSKAQRNLKILKMIESRAKELND